MLISYFRVTSWFDTVIATCRVNFKQKCYYNKLNTNNNFLITMYERDIRIHTVITSHRASKVPNNKNDFMTKL